MHQFSDHIVCAYLYCISKYGYPPAAVETLKHIEEMHQLGFKSIELEGIREAHLMEVFEMRGTLKNKLDELEMEVPYFCAVLPELSSADSKVRKKQLELFEKACITAKHLGSKGLIDNGPLPPYQFPGDIPVVRHYEIDVLQLAHFPRDLDWDQYWQSLVLCYQELCDMALDYDLTYHIHPAMGVLATHTDGFLLFAQAVDRPNLRFNFDTANLFVLKENLQLSLIRLARYIDYIHISDNRGLRTEHLAIGDGSIPWEIFFSTLKHIAFDGHFGIDIGGSESQVENLDHAYREAARWLTEKIK